MTFIKTITVCTLYELRDSIVYRQFFFLPLVIAFFSAKLHDGEKNLMEFAIAMQPNPFHCLSL